MTTSEKNIVDLNMILDPFKDYINISSFNSHKKVVNVYKFPNNLGAIVTLSKQDKNDNYYFIVKPIKFDNDYYFDEFKELKLYVPDKVLPVDIIRSLEFIKALTDKDIDKFIKRGSSYGNYR